MFMMTIFPVCLPVQPDLTLLSVKEAVDVGLAEADEGHEGKKMEGVHPSTFEFALCRLYNVHLYQRLD